MLPWGACMCMCWHGASKLTAWRKTCTASLLLVFSGGTSGRVAELDSGLNLVAEHPRSEKNIDKFSK